MFVAVLLFVLAAPLFGDPYKTYADGLGTDGLPVGVGTPGHPLGTDEIGRDMLTRAAWGGRQTLAFTLIANFTSIALGAVVGLMMWMWLSTIVVLVGAELNSEIEKAQARR